MLDYASPLAKAGGIGGAAASGGFMGTLGRLLEPLDYARQALWNIPGKLAEGDFVGALPGLLGAGLGAGLAATGVGAPLAILGGSLAGGLGQGIGKAADEERFEAPTGSHLMSALGVDPESTGGMVGGMALQALGDPLTYAGGLGGGKFGAQAGRKYGQHMTDVALTRGPMYEGGAEKMASALGKNASWEAYVNPMMKDPAVAKRILAEMPAGSEPLALGATAAVWKTPQGGVLRVGPGEVPPVPIPEMLQPARELQIGPYRVSHNPLVETIDPKNHTSPLIRELDNAMMDLTKSFEGKGYYDADMHLQNVGKTRSGNYAVLDPEAIELGMHMDAVPESINQAQGGRFTNWLLDRLGASGTIQRKIADFHRVGGGPQGIPLPEVAARAAAGYRPPPIPYTLSP